MSIAVTRTPEGVFTLDMRHGYRVRKNPWSFDIYAMTCDAHGEWQEGERVSRGWPTKVGANAKCRRALLMEQMEKDRQ